MCWSSWRMLNFAARCWWLHGLFECVPVAETSSPPFGSLSHSSVIWWRPIYAYFFHHINIPDKLTTIDTLITTFSPSETRSSLSEVFGRNKPLSSEDMRRIESQLTQQLQEQNVQHGTAAHHRDRMDSIGHHDKTGVSTPHLQSFCWFHIFIILSHFSHLGICTWGNY